MTRHLIAPTLLLIGLLAPTPADAMCLPSPTRVLTVTVSSCQESLERWRSHGSAADREDTAAFFREQIERSLETHRGVVITGTATRGIEVEHGPEGFTVLGPFEDLGTEGAWFVALPAETLAGDPCAAYPEGESIEIYSPPVCCDTLPPEDAACIHRVEAGAPVPDDLREFLADPPADHS